MKQQTGEKPPAVTHVLLFLMSAAVVRYSRAGSVDMTLWTAKKKRVARTLRARSAMPASRSEP
jgi:hypothetical protein